MSPTNITNNNSTITSTTHPVIVTQHRFFNGGSSGSPMRTESKNFVQYSEIDLPVPTRIQHIRDRGYSTRDHEWVCLEKVHGTNFGVYLLDEATVKYAKRSGILNDKENFFGYHVMTADFTKWINTAARLIKEKYGFDPEQRIGTVIMNGELFGAKYQHPDVPKSNKVAVIPGGVTQKIRDVLIQEEAFPQYSPELHYFCFDMKYSLRGSTLNQEEIAAGAGGADGSKQYQDLQLLPYDDFREICEAIKQEHPEFIYARPLIRGTLDECLTFDVEQFETPLPAELGLGDFKLKNNLAEGVIIKHVKRGEGAFDANAERAGISTILKLRSSHFMEVKHAGKAGEMRADFNAIRKKAIELNGGKIAKLEAASMMPEFQASANEILLNHVSDGRLNNVVSKIGKQVLIDGEVSQEKLATLLAKDALKDFIKDIDDPENILLSSPIHYREMMNLNCYMEALNVVRGRWKELTKPQTFDE